MNSTIEQLHSRKSVRVYEDRPIGPAEKQAIIDATILLGAARASVPPGTDWVFMGGMAMASCLWFTCLTLIVSLLGDRFTPRVLRWLNVVCGVCLFIYGVSLCLTAAGEIFG